jgi:hypothetical protein
MPMLTMTMTPTMIPAAKTTMAMAASVSAISGPLTSSRRLGPAGPDLIVLVRVTDRKMLGTRWRVAGTTQWPGLLD